ncbi:hypothetical protein UCRPC4_g05247 [Phaeomoniella chlamydospora]|uniref:Beta-catenin-like protein 1 N-terminal domain-containing protein n=1 Tax=Phaeomoniella chlamydospora TaxID=158046 RepID=A0A0G2E5Q5_PHACM|nr:hypothetical protein UCRPC4_g05247 [Phaeomoniella chlamydospora]
MTSVDELFRVSEIYKSAKISPNGTAKSNGIAHSATVEEDDDDDDDDVEAGPALPPDDEEESPDDDEEGRFFGGGISDDTKEVLDFIDSRGVGKDEDDEGVEIIDSAWLKKMAIGFERKINKNAEMRSRWENDPAKFMTSEADLDSDIKALSILSEHPELYDEFAKLGCVGSLISLLSHENTDIAIAAIEVIGELIDEDVDAEDNQWSVLVEAMLDADLIDLLTQNLARFDEKDEADRNGVYHVLSVIENLSSQSTIAEKTGRNSSIISWLSARIQQAESPVGQNRQYAAEVLAILLQASAQNRSRYIDADGVDTLLQLLSAYRKRDPPKDSEEEEYAENLFDALTCLVDEPLGKGKFLEAEGIELCLIMIREGKMSKSRALRVLDHALGGPSGASACEQLVEAVGLKTIFGMFMKKQERGNMEHILGIFSSLLRQLPGGSAARIRVLAKFVEKEYEKIDKIVALRREVADRVSEVDRVIASERRALSKQDQDDMEGEWLSRRFDAGLFSVQTIDLILAWLIAEDGGASQKIRTLLKDRDEDFGIIRGTLQEQLDGLEGDEASDADRDTQEMLKALLQFV